MLEALTPEQARTLDAYTAGVNAGLASLGSRPWEYLALRATPRPWTREDSVLVIDAMSMVLETDGSDERARAALVQTYGEEVTNFLRPLVTERSAALDGSNAPAPPVPDAASFVVRPFAPGEKPPVPVLNTATLSTDASELPGSNSFALAGARTAGGGALVANDPHLHLAVPNIWYRASFVLPEGTSTGATLPGVPALVIGSNGHIAWGFTNGYIDTCDLVAVDVDAANPGSYRVPDGDGWEPFEIVHETFAVHGRSPEACDVPTTRWGPLVTRPSAGGPVYARHWSEYDAGAINFNVADIRADGRGEMHDRVRLQRLRS